MKKLKSWIFVDFAASLEDAQDYDINEISQPDISGLQSEEISAKQDDQVKSSANVVSRKHDNFLSLFSLRDINSCIIISENKRIICSVMISLLVVLSYAHIPLSIARSNSFVASRPLYILLLTDFTIVIARIVRKEVISDEERAKDTERVKDFGQNLDGALSILEYGLVLYQTIRAIFIDCSFYLVIVICGLTLV
ncbi:hypothetical protein EJD97_011815 [Solanum chilense]|uniref:Uncharacterized protein n=1 Tax=Solanum chilense TaxID=4083 RepID=A0A6N2BF38_SOLCI|nr:hypothetical protein EJD97_011815 [Solanum chilense]